MTSILVTNGIRGVGLGVARAFAAMPNANITLHHTPADSDAEVASAVDTVRRVMKGNGRVMSAASDLTGGASFAADSLIAEAVKNFGRVDVLVAQPNWGVSGGEAPAMTEKLSDAAWSATLHEHLTLPFFLSRAVLPGMRERGFGRVIHMVSPDATLGRVQASALTAARHGVVGLTKSLALEVAHEGVTCNAVSHGLVTSPELEARVRARMAVTGEEYAEAQQELVQELVPTMRLVDMDEIGAACVYLALPSSKSVNGTILTLDGGLSVQ
jgi:3-hydroxybutyrate dehydrogenase